MDKQKNTCTACFSFGSKPHCRVFDNSTGAVIVFSSLHGAGRFPFMCMQSDNRYRVCHLPESSAAPSLSLRLRAA